jgi:nicotinamide mononucleotide adenylyltransferase
LFVSYVQLAQDQTQVGCHVQNFVNKWKQVTSDPWVLKIVEEGLRLKFVCKPPKSGVRTTNLLNIVHMSNILEEVKKLFMGICRYASRRSKVDPHSPTWRA